MRFARASLLLLAIALSAVACGNGTPTRTPAAMPGPTGAPASAGPVTTAPASAGPVTTAPASAGPVTTAPASTRPATAAPGSPGATVVEDPGLLALVPATLDGVTVNLEHRAFLDAVAADPAFAASIEAAAFWIALDGSDMTSGLIARPVAGRWSDAFFADWRATYDAGACGQAGGVVGQAQQTINGRTVYVTTCGGGLRVYHAYMQPPGVIVSGFSLGDRHLGELVMRGIHP